MGYGMRFGLIYVDFDTLTRTIKDSGRWCAQVIAANGLSALAPVTKQPADGSCPPAGCLILMVAAAKRGPRVARPTGPPPR